MTAVVVRGDAGRLPLPGGSVDLVVTSPPYFGLRSYADGGEHYVGQIGSEGTPGEYLEALWACTAEWVRVLRPSGSIFVNLGDKYVADNRGSSYDVKRGEAKYAPAGPAGFVGRDMARQKSLMGLPWRYAIGCVDRLGLILRAEVVWSKPNGLPESVQDRVRRSHEQVFHFTVRPRYFAAVDEIREPHTYPDDTRHLRGGRRSISPDLTPGGNTSMCNPLGKLPGSVWTIPSAPLIVPESLGIDHFACVDAETEILTLRGWLRHDQLTEGDDVAGYDLGTNTARWTRCSAVNRYDYDGDLIAVESRDISMRLTPNHRAIVQRMDARTKRRNPVAVVRADELDRYHFIPRSVSWEPYGLFYVGRNFAAVLGWVAAEGWYEGKRVRLSQSLDVNPANVAEIDRLIPDAGRSERRRTGRDEPWTEATWELGPMAASVQLAMPDKLLPWWFVTATEDERRSVLGAFIDGDGHRRPDGRIGIYQKLRHNLDVLQAVAVTLGYKTTIREGGGRFVLYLTEGGRSVTLRGTSGVGSKVRREHYKGVVWCPTTGTGTFIARRNGSVFVTGNSYPPELVRRIVLGWSPSGVCTGCGEGRRPVVNKVMTSSQRAAQPRSALTRYTALGRERDGMAVIPRSFDATITGYACGCPVPDAPARPALVVDPFGGTGTTALVASVLGRTGVTVDRSGDYCRLAAWRTRDRGERARAMNVPKPPPVPDGQGSLFDDEEAS